MRIQLSDHFSYKRLLRFVLPSILMIICTSVYSIVDGFFISNFVGKTPFAAINLIYPVLMAVGTLGFMAGTGGSAIVSKTLGEGKPEKANQYFSLLVYATLAFSILISVVGFIFIRPIAIVLGAMVFCWMTAFSTPGSYSALCPPLSYNTYFKAFSLPPKSQV